MRGLRQLAHCTGFEPIRCIPACMPFLRETLQETQFPANALCQSGDSP